jgi:hypothetical protein
VEIDQQRLARFAPFVLPIVLLVGGWLLLVQPRFGESARAGRALDAMRQRLLSARASVAEPAPLASPGGEIEAFERQMAAGDATAQLLEELARLAARAQVSNLLIETGERVSVRGRHAQGPQTDAAAGDPRLALFDVPLAYSTVTMSFDADYARLGELLWRVRDLATTLDIQSLAVGPRPTGAEARVQDGTVHVSLTLLAYARERTTDVALTGGAGR